MEDTEIKEIKETKKLKETKTLSKQTNIEILIFVLTIHCLLLYGFDAIPLQGNIWVQRLLETGYKFVVALPAVIGFLIQKRKIKDVFSNNRHFWKYSLVILLITSCVATGYTLLFYCFNPVDTGDMEFQMPKAYTIIYYLVTDILVTGLLEEFVFREFVLGTLNEITGHKGVPEAVISAVIFGLVHLVNGNWEQVAFATFLGLVLGITKQKYKDCTFLSCVLAHGMYNFINYMVGNLIYLFY